MIRGPKPQILLKHKSQKTKPIQNLESNQNLVKAYLIKELDGLGETTVCSPFGMING